MATRGNIFVETKGHKYVGAYKHYDCYPSSLGAKLQRYKSLANIKAYVKLLSKKEGYDDEFMYEYDTKEQVLDHLKHSDVSYAYLFNLDNSVEIIHYMFNFNSNIELLTNEVDCVWHSLKEAIEDDERN